MDCTEIDLSDSSHSPLLTLTTVPPLSQPFLPFISSALAERLTINLISFSLILFSLFSFSLFSHLMISNILVAMGSPSTLPMVSSNSQDRFPNHQNQIQSSNKSKEKEGTAPYRISVLWCD
jgi:hypothetical protein